MELPVEAFDPSADALPDFVGKIYRITWIKEVRRGLIRRKTVQHEVSWSDALDKFLSISGSEQVSALVIGDIGYENGAPVIETLMAAKERLPNLRALFVGDIVSEEFDVSCLWLNEPSTNFGPLIEGYPELEEFCVRGGIEAIGPVRHQCLKRLVIESGGMDRRIFSQLLGSLLPELEQLEVYLGDEGYGGDCAIEDVRPLLDSMRFPKLKHLGLRNAMFTDDIAVALVDSVVLDHIESLDLSLGTLGDRGAEALLGSEKVRRLKFIDLHHHYMSKAMVERWRASGLLVDVGDQQKESSGGRYVSVSE